MDFDAEAFLKLPLQERVKLCRTLAERANKLAASASPKYRGFYSEIAKQWLMLAEEMQASLRPDRD